MTCFMFFVDLFLAMKPSINATLLSLIYNHMDIFGECSFVVTCVCNTINLCKWNLNILLVLTIWIVIEFSYN
jgi:hypothetical protein